MSPPAAMAFSSLVAVTGLLFIVWHTWHYDRWRCLLYSRQDWFRALMCQILLFSVAFFVAYTWMEAYILYDEYYIFLQGKVIPAPWQLWSDKNQNLWRASLYILCTGWCFMQAVHLEEFLYWAYLIQGIRTAGGPRSSWTRSGFFKIWLAACLCTWALLFGASHIETSNLDMMQAYLFIVGSALSCVLAGASITLCLVFPKFVTSVKNQGATFEVMERLHFFAEMNQIRTVFRCLYAISFLTLSADALTAEKRINKSGFWSDLLDLVGHLAIFVSTCVSVIVLLPRNMNAESLPIKSDENMHPMVAYKRPLPPPTDGFSPRQFYELGDRLNIDRDTLGPGLMSPGFEMKSNPEFVGNKKDSEEQSDHQIPFAMAADRTRRTRFSEMPSLPGVVAKFKSPFETGQAEPRGPTKVYVTTSQTVHHG